MLYKGLRMVVLPTALVGLSTNAQPCVTLISTMHGQPFLIHLNLRCYVYHPFYFDTINMDSKI